MLLWPNCNPARSPAKSATSSSVFCINTYYSWPTGLGFSTDPGALFVDKASVPDPQMLCGLQSMQPYCKHKCKMYNTSNAQTNTKPIAPRQTISILNFYAYLHRPRLFNDCGSNWHEDRRQFCSLQPTIGPLNIQRAIPIDHMSLAHHICRSASHTGIVLSKCTMLLVLIQPKQPHYGCHPIKDRAFSQSGANPPNTAKPPEAIIPNQAYSKQSQESNNRSRNQL